MTPEPTAVLTQDQLANMAAAAFATERADVPDKIWVSTYQDTPFVRAAWATGLTCRRIERLEVLQTALSEMFDVPFTAVAYSRDCTWDDVNDREAALQRRR
jgi:predicted component of type VI protein secretion system